MTIASKPGTAAPPSEIFYHVLLALPAPLCVLGQSIASDFLQPGSVYHTLLVIGFGMLNGLFALTSLVLALCLVLSACIKLLRHKPMPAHLARKATFIASNLIFNYLRIAGQ